VSDQLEGRRPVLAALRAGRVRALYLADGAHHAIIDDLRLEATRRQIPIEVVPRGRLDAWSSTGKHQGVIADVERPARVGWVQALEAAQRDGRAPFLVALDGIQDPGNLGALIRSAAAFGADAIVIPEVRAAPLNPTVAKAAAGALDHVPVEAVRSLQATLEQAKELGLWLVALAEEGAADLEACRLLTEPVALIIGAEGRGVSRTLRLAADVVVTIDTDVTFGTLNASVAGAIAMHSVRRSRGQER